MAFRKIKELKDLKGNLINGSIEVTSTTIKLCKIPIQLHTGDTIWFSTPEKQQEFFEKYTVHEFENCTYVRIEEGFTQLPINVENLRKDVNYICIKNGGFSDKWYYCNILSINWVNTVTSKINFAIDTIQTFRFDMVFNQPSHIIKRHFSYENDGERVINGLPDISFDIGSKMKTIESGTIFDDNYDEPNKREIYVPCTPKTISDICYIVATSQPFKEFNSDNQIPSSTFKTYRYNSSIYLAGERLPYEPITWGGAGDTFDMMGCYYIFDSDCMDYCIKNNIFTSTKNNGIIQFISLFPIPWHVTINEHTNLSQRLTGAVHGRMIAISDLQPSNEYYIFCGANMFNYYIKALELINNNDDDYINTLNYLTNSLKGVDILNNSKNAIIQYLLRPYFTKLTVNDHNGNIIDYDFRFMFNGSLPRNIEDFTYYRNDTVVGALQYLGFKIPLSIMISVSPQPVINWTINRYNFGDDRRNNLVIEEDTIQGNLELINNDIWLKMIPNLYFPVVNDYFSMFLMSNQYQISAQRGNINRNYQTAIANASTTLDAGLNNAYLNYKGNVASAKALQANASIQYGASSQIALNSYNNAVGIAYNNLANAVSNNSNKYEITKTNIGNSYGYDNQLMGVLGGLNANPFSLFGLLGGIEKAGNMQIGEDNANNNNRLALTTATNNANTAYLNASESATTSYNNALIQASATANMMKNTANAQMTMAYNAYKGQQGILNANYQNELRNAKTVQQNALDMLNASIRDAQNVADTITAQYQGDNSNMFSTVMVHTWKIGCIQPNYLKRIINTFKYYGFTCNEFNKIDDVINKWEVGGYIQTSNCMVTGSIPYQWLLDIIDQFNTGIRLWKDEENFLNYDGILNQ